MINVCQPQHSHREWIRFLRLIDRRTPPDKQLHLILDNYATHKTPEVKRWLARHRRFHLHFVPTSSSWLNMVERFFRDLTVKRIRRGAFHSVKELEDTIRDYIDRHNQNPNPYLWTAKARDILEKVKRGWAALNAQGYVPKKGGFAARESIERRLNADTETPELAPALGSLCDLPNNPTNQSWPEGLEPFNGATQPSLPLPACPQVADSTVVCLC